MCAKEVQGHKRVHRFAMQQKAIEALRKRPENRCFSHVFRHALLVFVRVTVIHEICNAEWMGSGGKKEMEHEGSCS